MEPLISSSFLKNDIVSYHFKLHTFLSNQEIHCDWSDYEVTSCSQTCGDGTLTKTRTKLIEENEYGFCDMEGEVGTVQTFQETCNVMTCPRKSYE